MKLIHLADLHIGKKFNEISLEEDQRIILRQILDLAKVEKPDAVLISGDVYDKAQPAAYSINILDAFLSELAKYSKNILMIAGNHDAPARIAYGKDLFANLNIFVAGKLAGYPDVIRLFDEFGAVNFVLLPFFRLHELKVLFPEHLENFNNYTDAVSFLLNGLALPKHERKVILSHQFFSGIDQAILSDSEMDIVGGLDYIDAKILLDFTYAALGHLHRPQRLLQDKIRYAGSPLAYSFSEMNQTKIVPLVYLDERLDDCNIKKVPLKPLREVREIKGRFADLLSEAASVEKSKRYDLLRVVLTDNKRLVNPMRRLQVYYPNIVQLLYESDEQEMKKDELLYAKKVQEKNFLELFADFYKEQNDRELSDDDKSRINRIWNKIQEERERTER